ncbi:MFS transporter [Microbacterium saperdae]|uniref:Putative MFS family arabinose efflux permease n=1 Tax=Microbacterium saperdae TaxID=69368 RepID=A0A543BLD2_9MICO|nr:MFS transporter [Microbacterium saperdae]TQL85618.1 putative MFS family arabinose efflux permease [Microbacterium saperdae]GGM62190.1 MFS transporter [Microbacterium saperdae]
MNQSTSAVDQRKNSPTRAAIAAMAGGTLEYYDNYIYALAAALVFGQVFFPGDDPGLSTVLALATFAVSYVARPLGAVLLGHFGDRIGRKKVLVFILVLMGTCTFVVGLLPGYAQIGAWAPILLVTLRLLQGISVGGETAAATVLTIEIAPARRRAFFTSWAPNGIVGGFVLATLIFIPISALPEEALLSWGWRLPFLLSAIVTVAGFVIRATLDEPEAFIEAKEDNALVKVPVLEVFRSHWASILRVVFCSLAFAIDTVIKVFALAFATREYGLAESTMLWVLIVSHVGALVTQPILAMLADRIGRRPVFIAGNLACAAMLFAYFGAIQAQNVPLLFVTGFLSVAGAYAAINAVYPSMFAEMFNLKVRQTGMALGQQIGLIAAGFAPSVYLALTAGDPKNWLPVAIISAVIAGIAALTALLSKETAFVPLDDLGSPITRSHTIAGGEHIASSAESSTTIGVQS